MNKSIEQNSNGTYARKAEEIANGLHGAINSAANAASPVIDNLTASAHQAADKMAGSASRAAEVLEQKSRQLKDSQARLTESCRTHMREKPLTSLGIAVAAGVLLALIFKNR